MGVVFFLFLTPVILAMLAFIIAIIVLIGICLLVISFTGMGMNKIHEKQTGKRVSSGFSTISSLLAGLIMVFIPIGYGLYMLIQILMPGG